MAKWTIELRNLVKTTPIFNFPYPMIEGYRSEFERKFIDHYYYDEIGMETADKFIQRLRSKLDMIMPYYVKLYESEWLRFNPFETYSITEAANAHEDNMRFLDSVNYGRTGGRVRDSEANEDKQTFGEDYTSKRGRNQETIFDGKEQTERISEYDENLQRKQDTLEHETLTKDDTHTADRTIKATEETTGTDGTSRKLTGTENLVLNEDEATKSKELFVDTPQTGFVIGVDGIEQGEGNLYATTVRQTDVQRNLNRTADTTTEQNEQTDFTTQRTRTTDTTDSLGEESTSETERDLSRGITESQGLKATENMGQGIKTDNTETITENADTTDNRQNTTDRKGNINRLSDSDMYKSGNQSAEQKEKNTRSTEHTLTGRKMVSPSNLLEDYRKTFLNIDRMIIEECADLFLGVY